MLCTLTRFPELILDTKKPRKVLHFPGLGWSEFGLLLEDQPRGERPIPSGSGTNLQGQGSDFGATLERLRSVSVHNRSPEGSDRIDSSRICGGSLPPSRCHYNRDGRPRFQRKSRLGKCARGSRECNGMARVKGPPEDFCIIVRGSPEGSNGVGPEGSDPEVRRSIKAHKGSRGTRSANVPNNIGPEHSTERNGIPEQESRTPELSKASVSSRERQLPPPVISPEARLFANGRKSAKGVPCIAPRCPCQHIRGGKVRDGDRRPRGSRGFSNLSRCPEDSLRNGKEPEASLGGPERRLGFLPDGIPTGDYVSDGRRS